MEVILASCGNPDHFQDPYRPMWGCEDNRKVQVESIEEASEICAEFSRRNNLGGGSWAGGQVISKNVIIAQIGHNGITRLPGDKFFHVPSVYWEHELYNLK
jgi:hypothetical protein